MRLSFHVVRTVLVGTLCAVAIHHPVAEAEPYVRLLAGAGFTGDEDLTGRGTLPGNATANTDVGWTTTGAVGWALGAWRIETDLSYRRNGLEDARFGTAGRFSEGDFASLVIGANVIREFNLLPDERVLGYVGAGVAYFEEVDLDLENATTERSFSDSGVGPQVLFGARYALWKHWDLFAEYRYVHAGNLTLAQEGGTGRIETDYDAHSISAGVGFRF
jgi:opacity protein-like surface antigen